jgi:predicted RNA-binding Zn-ribbon protein involved in translation (DUF1610 family)
MEKHEALYKDVSSLEVVSYFKRSSDFDDGVGFILEKLDAIPVADVEPVRHASWERVETDEDGYSRFRCPNCDWKTVFSRSPSRGMDDYAYCPRCGAKMDGE